MECLKRVVLQDCMNQKYQKIQPTKAGRPKLMKTT